MRKVKVDDIQRCPICQRLPDVFKCYIVETTAGVPSSERYYLRHKCEPTEVIVSIERTKTKTEITAKWNFWILQAKKN